jgi:nucleotide-binding universal stress UspA family protein
MSFAFAPDVPFVNSVFHPSDFSGASDDAFAHALAIAIFRQAEFTLLHVVPDDRAVDVWSEFPAVRGTLERWGLLEEGSPRSAVFDELGVTVRKINLRNRDVLGAVTEYLDERPTDLIVLATEGRDGVPRWIQRSVAERLSRKSKTKTLFVPHGARGFVSMEDGTISLQRILVPIDASPSPRDAVIYASRAASLAGEDTVAITLLHVGEENETPRVEPLPDAPWCAWETRQEKGDVVEGITRVAEETSADLIVMATQGREGILDALRGSVTEQVVRRGGCPVLAVPAE